jgi:hypothetical protein
VRSGSDPCLALVVFLVGASASGDLVPSSVTRGRPAKASGAESL